MILRGFQREVLFDITYNNNIHDFRPRVLHHAYPGFNSTQLYRLACGTWKNYFVSKHLSDPWVMPDENVIRRVDDGTVIWRKYTNVGVMLMR